MFRDTAGKVTVVHTDTLGNFYLPGATAVTAGMMVGVRDGTTNGNSPMPDLLQAGKAGGGCNAGGTCHGGTQGKIHVP